MLDQISLGNPFELQANVNQTAGSDIFDKSYETDISNALYGQFSGLLVKTGSSTYTSNQAKLKLALRLHGHSPIILVDGFPRSVDDLTGIEIESVTVLKDAAAAALYGVKGGDGVVMIPALWTACPPSTTTRNSSPCTADSILMPIRTWTGGTRSTATMVTSITLS